jgi:curli biogenesis system outer membrane secretion channel CsgG
MTSKLGYLLTILLLCFCLIGCATIQTTSELREDGTKAGIYPPPPVGFVKQRIAVLPFSDKTKHRNTHAKIGDQALDIATTLLVNTDRFDVVERERLNDLLKEQQLVGIVDPETAAKAGQVLGAQYIFTGAITDFEVKRTKSGFNFGLPPIGNLPPMSIGKDTYTLSIFIAVDARIIDTTTGQVFFANTGEIKREEKASGFAFGIGGAYIDSEGAIKLDETSSGRQLRMALDVIILKMLPKIDRQMPEPKIEQPIQEPKTDQPTQEPKNDQPMGPPKPEPAPK